MAYASMAVVPCSRLFRVLAVVTCVLAASLVGAEKAWAPSVRYDCGVLEPHHYCIHDVLRRYAENHATYYGSDEISVTSKLIFNDERMWGEAFGLSDDGTSVKLISYRTGNFTKPLISNNSGMYATIFGTAIW